MKKWALHSLSVGLIAGVLCLVSGYAIEASDSLAPIANDPSKIRAQTKKMPADSIGHTQEYCILPVGDVNGDGRGDTAISKHPATTGTAAITYVILGAEAPFPEAFDETRLREKAAYILRGTSARPFACTPQPASLVSGQVVRSAAVAEFSPVVSKPVSVGGPSPVGQPISYTMVDLNLLTPNNYSIANAINSSGQVVGQFLNAQGQEHAYLFDGWELRDLGTLGGHFSTAFGINAQGETTGYSLTGETDERGFVQSAFISNGLSLWDLGIRWSSASDINGAGQIVGSVLNVDTGDYHAFLFDERGLVDLGTLEGRQSFANAVNEVGQVAGATETFIPGTRLRSIRGFLHEGGTMRDLGSLGYFCFLDDNGIERCFEHSEAADINNQGQIAGFSTTGDRFNQHAFLSDGGVMEDLGTLGGNQSWAMAVNDSGQVVGSSTTSTDAYQAFLLDQGTLYDLSELVTNRPANFGMWTAQDINNFGQIVGVNYLLNPNYESIAPGREFSFNDHLGQKLNFEYWVSAGDSSRCSDQRTWVGVEVRIELGGRDRIGDPALRPYLNRWLPADRLVRGCEDFVNWRNASIILPATLQGKLATVKVRVKKHGKPEKPTIYLRHFSMN